jgi:hypothetical protein
MDVVLSTQKIMFDTLRATFSDTVIDFALIFCEALTPIDNDPKTNVYVTEYIYNEREVIKINFILKHVLVQKIQLDKCCYFVLKF